MKWTNIKFIGQSLWINANHYQDVEHYHFDPRKFPLAHLCLVSVFHFPSPKQLLFWFLFTVKKFYPVSRTSGRGNHALCGFFHLPWCFEIHSCYCIYLEGFFLLLSGIPLHKFHSLPIFLWLVICVISRLAYCEWSCYENSRGYVFLRHRFPFFLRKYVGLELLVSISSVL